MTALRVGAAIACAALMACGGGAGGPTSPSEEARARFDGNYLLVVVPSRSCATVTSTLRWELVGTQTGGEAKLTLPGGDPRVEFDLFTSLGSTEVGGVLSVELADVDAFGSASGVWRPGPGGRAEVDAGTLNLTLSTREGSCAAADHGWTLRVR